MAKMKRVEKIMVLLACVLALISASAGPTTAFLIDAGETVENIFSPSLVRTKVDETLSGSTKSNVRLQNTGNTEGYIRAAIVVTWQDAAGNVHPQIPLAGADYDIVLDLTGGWEQGSDGFYYWKNPVKPLAESGDDCFTGVLITSCEPKGVAPDGYYLSVQILGSSIQSQPRSVVTAVWDSGVRGVAADGTLVIG